MRRLLSAPVLLSALAGSVLLAGCGDSTSESADDSSSSAAPSASASASDSASTATPTPTPSAATSSAAPVLASCDSVWVDGQKLSFPYAGCVDGARTVKAQVQPCEIGKPLVTYRNSFWATPGGPVHQVSGTLAADSGWRRALIQCGG